MVNMCKHDVLGYNNYVSPRDLPSYLYLLRAKEALISVMVG